MAVTFTAVSEKRIIFEVNSSSYSDSVGGGMGGISAPLDIAGSNGIIPPAGIISAEGIIPAGGGIPGWGIVIPEGPAAPLGDG